MNRPGISLPAVGVRDGEATPELRHYARRDIFGDMEIVDRVFDWVRCRLPYDYRWTSNSQQWDEARRICEALAGPMQAQGVVSIADTSDGKEIPGETKKSPSRIVMGRAGT